MESICMKLNQLTIKHLTLKYPIIQGGMGVGISRSNLAGAVAKEGGLGVISTAQIGYDEEGFESSPIETNLAAIRKHVKKAKEIAPDGVVGVNIMVATNEYQRYVKASVEAGVDVIISGAGLPISLPELVEGSNTLIAPIVSSKKATEVILKMWDRKNGRTADFIVVEGPFAGGHLGFKKEELIDIKIESFEEEVKEIVAYKKQYEDKYNVEIPVFLAGGIATHQDILHALSLGVEGVQIATRFVVTKECDASLAFKEAYLKAREEDVQIVTSPVGMPGRAIRNPFIERTYREEITRCYRCLSHCNPKEIPYCITKALIEAVRGNVDNGLIFCGQRVGDLKKMTTVHDLMLELIGESVI